MPTGYELPRAWAMSDDSMRYIRYSGTSMHPILQNGDRLEVIPVGKRGIRRGDVIVFQAKVGGSLVVHRVIAMDSGRIRTFGDNNILPDDWLASQEEVIGSVVFAQRGRKRIRIHGGFTGVLLGFTLRAFFKGKRLIIALLRPIYQHLVQTGSLRRCLPFELKTRVVSYQRPAGAELHLFLGRRSIGTRAPGEEIWRIRPPFGLFLDAAKMPQGDPGRRAIKRETAHNHRCNV